MRTGWLRQEVLVGHLPRQFLRPAHFVGCFILVSRVFHGRFLPLRGHPQAALRPVGYFRLAFRHEGAQYLVEAVGMAPRRVPRGLIPQHVQFVPQLGRDHPPRRGIATARARQAGAGSRQARQARLFFLNASFGRERIRPSGGPASLLASARRLVTPAGAGGRPDGWSVANDPLPVSDVSINPRKRRTHGRREDRLRGVRAAYPHPTSTEGQDCPRSPIAFKCRGDTPPAITQGSARG